MVRHSVDFPEKIRPTDTNSLFDSGQVSIWTFTHCIHLDFLFYNVFPLDWIYMTWILFRSALVVVISLFITRIDRSPGLSPGQISTWVSADRHPLSSHQHYVQPDFRPLSFGRSEFDNRSALRWGECSENAIISVAASCLNDQHLVILSLDPNMLHIKWWGNCTFKNCKIGFFLSPRIRLSPPYVRYFEHRKVRRRLEVKSEVSSATTAWFLRLLSLFDQNLTSTPTANRQPSGQQDTPSSKIPKVVNIFASDLRPNILLKNL